LPVVLRKILVFHAVLVLATVALGEGTRTWEQSKFDDLTKGTTQGVAVRSAGGLELAPAFKNLYTTPSAYIWKIAADPQGNLYAAAGGPARVYRVTSSGQSSTIFETHELQVQALVVGKNGVIYTATNPDGKVYKIERSEAAGKDSTGGKTPTGSWSSSVYFDPGTKYIWDLALDGAGNVYVATGDRGEIFRVTPKGEHSTFFTSDEAHIRVLAFDAKGNLIAGSDDSGLVYRIAPDGKAFVLYSAPKKEITALALDGAGNIYAAGVGEKRAPASALPLVITPVPAPTTQHLEGAQAGITISGFNTGGPMMMTNFPAPGSGATGGSEIYRIAPDGSPDRIWTSKDDLVYALAFDQHGRLLAGTGNRGNIFAIRAEDEFTELLKASASQITAFTPAPGGGLYASTSNLGKLFLMSEAPESEGSYESDVFDAHIFSRWGRAEVRSQGNVEIFARSGNVDNPDRNWSAWEPVDLRKDAKLKVPAARFVQWKAVLHAGNPAPEVASVTLNYLQRNVAPDFGDITVQKDVRYQSLPKQVPADANAPGQPHFDIPVPSIHEQSSIGVRWTVHDDNDDDMIYSVYYRGDGETRWMLLKDKLTDKFYSFDASLLPDGGYTIKVFASDAPSHSPGEALTSEKESDRFEVDTTPPQIENLTASVEGGQVHVSFRAADSFSPIQHAECSVDAGDWQFVGPADQISDSKTENYDFRIPSPSDAGSKAAAGVEHVVVVRVYDRFDNMSSAKTVIRAK
jgi:sugar lactone lactonase YvrE